MFFLFCCYELYGIFNEAAFAFLFRFEAVKIWRSGYFLNDSNQEWPLISALSFHSFNVFVQCGGAVAMLADAWSFE